MVILMVVELEISEEYKSLSPAEFFYRNKEITGFSNPVRAMYQTVRELVENALDATDVYGILPSIKIIISRCKDQPTHYTITVEDNGIGVPPQYAPQAFGQVLFSSKYKLRQSRGRFGLGAKMAILYGQLTTGKPVEVITSTIASKYVYYFKIMIDIVSNTPIVMEKASWLKKWNWHGTIVSVTIEGDWGRARSRIIEYIKRTSIVTPYAEIAFIDPDGRYYYFPRSTEKIPRPPKEVLPHPQGIDVEYMKMLIKSTKAENLYEFLVQTFQGVGKTTAGQFFKETGLNPNLNPKDLSLSEVEDLVQKLKSFKGFKSPRSDALSPIGEDLIELGLKNIFNPEFATAVTRKPSVYEGHPFVVEVGIAYGGTIQLASTPILLRYANKIPLLYDEKADVTWKILENFDWKYYGVDFPAPLVVLVHICSTKVPYKGVGKESIAEVPEIEREILNGLREVARRLKIFLAKKRKEEEARRKLITFIKYLPEISRCLATLSMNPETGEKTVPETEIMNKLLEILKRKLNLAEASEGVVKKIVVGIE